MLQALVENRKRSIPYAGAFLVKNEEDVDPNIVTSSDSEKSIHNLKGKELLKHLHEVGTLALVFGYFAELVGNNFYCVDFEMFSSLFHVDSKHSRGSGDAIWSPSFTDN